MATRRPPRLDPCCYLGIQRCFITITTFRRREYFRTGAPVTQVTEQLLRTSDDYAFELLAYCFMPDHLHLLAEALRDDCDVRKFVSMFKQRSGHDHRRAASEQLWQESYYDHVLRDQEATPAVVAYIVGNPVRAGLCESPIDYPFLGSSRYSRAELCRYVQSGWHPPGSRR